MSKKQGSANGPKPETAVPGTNWDGKKSTGGIVNPAPAGLSPYGSRKGSK